MLRCRLRPSILAVTALPLIVSACSMSPDGLGLDFGPQGAQRVASEAAPIARPEPDEHGLITYPNYQVAVARRGESLAELAGRLGIGAAELARFNGRALDDPLRAGEIIALPYRLNPGGEDRDFTRIAGEAIDRAGSVDADGNRRLIVQNGVEPVRHQVVRGETAYSIARLYGVSVRALADWNGLGPDLSVREGQFLLIPLAGAGDEAPREVAANAPGSTPTPVPPSAAQPLPEPVESTALPDAPDLDTVAEDAETETTSPAEALPSDVVDAADAPEPEPDADPRLQRPVNGTIVRGFSSAREGVDFGAPAGTPVRAAAAGTVAAITQDTDAVSILVLRHSGNLLTVYANIDGVTVARGDSVDAGQSIAEVGGGNDPFLHFEVRRGMSAVDPEDFF